MDHSEDKLGQLPASEDMSDGLPIVTPTTNMVELMLRGHDFDPDAVVAVLQPSLTPTTWRMIAVNAVMAGCLPAYLPVIGAAVSAVAADEFNLLGIQSTTGSATPLVVVNGPIVRGIGMNAGGNALGPGNRANATIGRALRLILQNIGGARSGETDMSTLGQPGKYTFCLAENETANPWSPLHCDRGFAADDSVVTVVGASGSVEVVDSSSRNGQDLVQTYAQSMLIAGTVGSGGLLGSGEPVVIFPPEHADLLARDGYTKAGVKDMIHDRATLSLNFLSPGVRDRILKSRSIIGDCDINSPLRVARKATDIVILVAGGVGVKGAYIPTWSGITRAVSRKVVTESHNQ